MGCYRLKNAIPANSVKNVLKIKFDYCVIWWCWWDTGTSSVDYCLSTTSNTYSQLPGSKKGHHTLSGPSIGNLWSKSTESQTHSYRVQPTILLAYSMRWCSKKSMSDLHWNSPRKHQIKKFTQNFRQNFRLRLRRPNGTVMPHLFVGTHILLDLRYLTPCLLSQSMRLQNCFRPFPTNLMPLISSPLRYSRITVPFGHP